MRKRGLLVVVVGATAVGKTSVAIRLAQHFRCEIISADARQFYRELEIGTAKPTAAELAAVPHHFINSHSVLATYSAGQFARDVQLVLPTLFARCPIQIMVGGSGLYVRAVCEGLDDMPTIGSEVRGDLQELLAQEGIGVLLAELQQSDPVYFDQVDHANVQRVVRALAIIRQSGRPYSHFRTGGTGQCNDFDVIKIGLKMDRATLYASINARMERMIAQGLFEEAQSLLLFKDKNALQTVGYKEIFDYLEGKIDRQETIRLLKRNSRRFAKRQITWFSKDAAIHWFEPSAVGRMIVAIDHVR